MRRSRSILLEKEAQQAQINISVYNKITKNRKLLDLEDYFQTRDDRPIDAPFFHVRTHNITSLAKYGHTHPTIKEYDDTTEVTGIRRQNQSPVSIITKVVELEADSTSRRDRHTDSCHKFWMEICRYLSKRSVLQCYRYNILNFRKQRLSNLRQKLNNLIATSLEMFVLFLFFVAFL